MQEEQLDSPYQISIESFIAKVEKYSWTDIDENPEQLIPKGVLQFEPAPHVAKYYRRLRFALLHQQISERMAQLCSLILKINTNNYYALMVRKQFVFQQREVFNDPCRMEAELFLANCLLDFNPKEYQLWNYKKDLLRETAQTQPNPSRSKIISAQLDFINHIIENDDRHNYHVWDFRTFLARNDPWLIESELKKTEVMLFTMIEGGQNEMQGINSLWSYRYHLVSDSQQRANLWQNDTKKIMDLLQRNPKNEGAWNYLAGMHLEPDFPEDAKINTYNFLEQNIEKLGEDNRFCLNYLLELSSVHEKKVQYVCKLMRIDQTRQLYYEYLLQELDGQDK